MPPFLRLGLGDPYDAVRHTSYRSPGQDELATGREFLDNPQGLFSERLADFCLVLFNLDEFLYVE